MKKTLLIALISPLLCLSVPTPAQILEQDSLALVSFYNSTGGPNWDNNTGWLADPVSTWFGVSVEGNRVTKLGSSASFAFNNLIGDIPIEIGNLTQLKELYIGNNPNLSGEIPSEIGNLINLEGIGIGNCSLNGTIPYTIGNCSLLWVLNFNLNNLSGSIPPEIGNLINLQFLDLHDNQLSGPIPPELGNCIALIKLELNDNNLSGPLPVELTNIPNLKTLYVNNNNLSGSVDDAFSYVGSYESLSFSSNQFDYFPPFHNWYSLNDLAVDRNRLNFNHLQSHANAGYMWFDYYGQAQIGQPIDTILHIGDSFTIECPCGGDTNYYNWYKNDDLILTMSDSSSLVFNSITAADSGKYDCVAGNWLLPQLELHTYPVYIHVDTSQGTGEARNKDSDPVCFPNPLSNMLYITIPGNETEACISIYSPTGQCLHSCIRSASGGYRICISETAALPSGVYIVRIHTERSSYTQKIIKNNH